MNALERLTAALCSRPGTENMDRHHADLARQILDQHAKELGRERDASYWRQRFETEANVRWDDGCPPGGMVCATCGEPVESEPCPEHNPKAIVAAGHKLLFGRIEGFGVVQLADMLREDATALVALGEDEVASTDDPLTLMRCLHATVGALSEIAPAALTAARLNPEATAAEDASVAAIHDHVTQGLARAHNALRDATDCI